MKNDDATGQNGWNAKGNEMAEMSARFRKDKQPHKYSIHFNADADVYGDAGVFLAIAL